MDNLATLVSMGFDIEESENVLQQGNISIQEAIQRLLEQKVATADLKEEKSQPKSDALASSSTFDQEKNEHENLNESNVNGNLMSRFAMSERQKIIKEEFEKKIQKDAQICAKKRKLQDRETKALVLKEIEANKKHTQQLRCKVDNITDASNQPKHQTESESLEKTNDSNERKCKIQVRMPNGTTINGQFAAEDSLSSVLEYVMSKTREEIKDSENPVFIQPFPRREFHQDEQRRSLFDLGLCPNSSLVFVTKREAKQQGSSNISIKTDESGKITKNVKSGAKIHSVYDRVSIANNEHSWGDGISLAGASIETKYNMEEDNSNHIDVSQSAFLHAVLPDSSSSENEGKPSPSHLSCSDNFSLENENDVIRRKNAVIEAIERRALSSAISPPKLVELRSKRQMLSSLERDISSLANLSADVVAKNLTSQNKAILSYVGKSLSQKAVNQVINALKTRKLLTGKILNLLHPCKLAQLNLNFYTLTSNEILEAARLHSTLVILSLSECSLITDNGVIIAVRGLKSLQILDLSGCVQVTDKSLIEIQELTCLRCLKLDKTKVTDVGLSQFLSSPNRYSLLQLSLNSTKITENGFPSKDKGIKLNLLSLFLDHSNVKCLEFLSSCKALNLLSLSGSNIQTESFKNIKQLCDLKEIQLNYTRISNDDLRHLVGLPLRIIGLPDRLLINDTALKNIQGLPLVELNLADYIHVTDSGLISIGKIISLTSLCLANTKITDQGLHSLSNLKKLQELDLSKTQIGDSSIVIISELRCIQTLNLASTRITNECFKNGTMNMFINLVKLNLSRNRISDAGIRHLRLPCLEMINADQTYIQMNILHDLKGCSSLKVARAHNCRSEEEMTESN